MNERSKPVAIVAGLLFAVYTLGWFANWLLRHHHHRQEAVGIAEIVLIGLIVAVAMFRWAGRWPLIEAMPRLVVAIAIGCVASAVISPFAGGSYPFKGGAGDFFLKIWIFLGASLVGMLLGYIAVVAVGKDYRTAALRRVEAARLKAARVARLRHRQAEDRHRPAIAPTPTRLRHLFDPSRPGWAVLGSTSPRSVILQR
jgi:predicted membrane protein